MEITPNEEYELIELKKTPFNKLTKEKFERMKYLLKCKGEWK